MPETYGLPEPELTRRERIEPVIVNAIAGQGVVRRIVLYVVVFAALGTASFTPFAVIPALVALMLLTATDKGLE